MTITSRTPLLPCREDDRGASAVEYGLLITGIAALIVVAVFAFGGGVGGLFSHSCQQIVNTASHGSDSGCG